jgi:uncharacterized protein
VIGGVNVHYVIRLGPDFRSRQLLVFRDADDPDLWLATDGAGHWSEVNGSTRPDLDGCWDLDLGCTPFTNSIPIRALALAVGESTTLNLAWVNVETLGVEVSTQVYTRVAEREWCFAVPAGNFTATFAVDADGLVLDYPGLFRRTLAP